MRRPTRDGGDGSDGGDTGHGCRSGYASAPVRAFRAGEHAPDFCLPDQNGRFVFLSDMLRTRPAVLCFLGQDRKDRSDAQLLALESQSAQIVRHGGSIIALLPRWQPCPEPSIRLLYDPDHNVAGLYGLCRPRAEDPLFSFSGRTGDVPPATARAPCPIPATFVVDQDGMIVMSLVGAPFDSDFVPGNVVCTLIALRRREGRYP